MTTFADKLALLRAALKQKGLDAYIIPTADPHLGEYISDHWKIIQWLTGFTGSAATVIITDTFSGLWTDSRYFLQAEKELADTGFVLMKPDPFHSPEFSTWLSQNISTGSHIGFDGRIISLILFRKLRKELECKNVIFDVDCDLVSGLWEGRPPVPSSPAWDFPVVFAGKDRSFKIAEVRKAMIEKSVDYHLITSPDDIMWLLNIRGGDVKYSPLLTSFALMGEEQTLLFVEEFKIPPCLAGDLDKSNVVTLPYDETAGMLSTLPEGSSVLIAPATTSVALYNSIRSGCRITEGNSIPARLKTIKNKAETENLSKVMTRDGVALARFFHFVENNLGKVPMTEVSLAGKLLEFRSMQKDFLYPSFATITAFNEHSALPHYSPSSGTDSVISETGLLLIDSGGQYYGGTTDITRTVAIGNPSLQQKRDFTLVLKGHINLALAKFPAGTKGYQIDILARKFLWKDGMDYGHGTGHGVGYCLNVHEGPQNISPSANKTIIEAGMLISNEPAVYREGHYGIRTENLIICYEDEETEFGKFLRFDTISLCYIDKALIDNKLLDKWEVDWINSYHTEVYEKLSPHLNPDERTWLKEKTESL